VVQNPRAAYRAAIDIFYPVAQVVPGVSSRAVIEPTAIIGERCHVGPGAIVGAHTVVEAGAAIMAGAIIGEGCRIGSQSVIHSSAVLYPHVSIGKRVVVHAGAIIGKDGFGFHRDENGVLVRVRQVGSVLIEDDVEIGACSCVDRATLGVTIVGRGTKLDSLVIVGHNARLGPDCLVIGQTGIAGSTSIGARTNLYAQVGVRGHVQVGESCTILARSAVWDDVPAASVVGGVPAVAAARWRRILVAISKLPELMKLVAGNKRHGAPDPQR